MGTTNFILILVAEALALSIFVTAIVLLKNRKLRRLVSRLQARIEEMASHLKKAKQPAPIAPKQETYNEKLDQQIDLTKDYHHSLGSRQDIALDLDPDAPLPRRTAALRHAFLIAEKEATAKQGAISWDFLASRYRQILSFHEDYDTPPDKGNQEELDQLKEELVQAKKRINNLERFKAMYLDLEERWDKCKDKANEHYVELKNIAEQSGQKENFERLLDHYHASYSDIGVIIEKGFNETIASAMADNPEDHLQEIRRLRTVAADQHKIITELQNKLQTASSKEEKEQVVGHLQTELQKQARFLQESETCIKLMEDELANTKLEMKQLMDRAGQLPQLKAELKELQNSAGLHEQVVESLKQENRRLAKKLKIAQEAQPEDNQEVKSLRKELTNMQAKYNDLEEKFLNLKLKE